MLGEQALGSAPLSALAGASGAPLPPTPEQKLLLAARQFPIRQIQETGGVRRSRVPPPHPHASTPWNLKGAKLQPDAGLGAVRRSALPQKEVPPDVAFPIPTFKLRHAELPFPPGRLPRQPLPAAPDPSPWPWRRMGEPIEPPLYLGYLRYRFLLLDRQPDAPPPWLPVRRLGEPPPPPPGRVGRSLLFNTGEGEELPACPPPRARVSEECSAAQATFHAEAVSGPGASGEPCSLPVALSETEDSSHRVGAGESSAPGRVDECC